MAKQLELRRGTTQANNLFTGVVGEVTMDTDTKQLRVHDGVKTGGYAVDTLVDFQVPSAGNNYTWYRKYASGWVEQGGSGSITSNGNNINLAVTMADANYTVLLTISVNTTTTCRCYARTTTYISVASANNTTGCWQVSGMAAA